MKEAFKTLRTNDFPFQYEKLKRRKNADRGFQEMQENKESYNTRFLWAN